MIHEVTRVDQEENPEVLMTAMRRRLIKCKAGDTGAVEAVTGVDQEEDPGVFKAVLMTRGGAKGTS